MYGSGGDFVMFILFGCVNFTLAAYMFGLEFTADSLSFMILYLWARKTPNMDVNFLDVFNFRSCFIPYFYLALTILSGFWPGT